MGGLATPDEVYAATAKAAGMALVGQHLGFEVLAPQT